MILITEIPDQHCQWPMGVWASLVRACVRQELSQDYATVVVSGPGLPIAECYPCLGWEGVKGGGGVEGVAETTNE